MNQDRPASDPKPAAEPLSDSLRWALAFGTAPDRSALDWLATELDSRATDATDAVLRSDPDPEHDRARLLLLKNGFKTLRIGSEHASDRRMAARFYAATIAAAPPASATACLHALDVIGRVTASELPFVIYYVAAQTRVGARIHAVTVTASHTASPAWHVHCSKIVMWRPRRHSYLNGWERWGSMW